MATFQVSIVSVASAGRSQPRLGIARSLARAAADCQLSQSAIPGRRKFSGVPLSELGGQSGMGRGVGITPLPPGCLILGATAYGGAPVRESLFGYVEPGLERPAHDLLGPPDLL